MKNGVTQKSFNSEGMQFDLRRDKIVARDKDELTARDGGNEMALVAG